jgi:hypothetical protein
MSDFSSRLPKGRAVASTVLRLVIASLIVGALLAVFGLNPIEMWLTLWQWLEDGVTGFLGTGVQGVALIGTLILTGAIIVVPIWLLRTLLRRR